MRTVPSLLLLCLLALLAGHALPASAHDPDLPEKPDRVLQGHIDGKDNLSYRQVPFDVPSGISRITVAFHYTGHDQDHTAIDLGLLGPDGFQGPNGFRGWSGGSKQLFTLSATDATPSYLPGPIPAGRWSLLLGIPNIRKDSHASYTADIWFNRADDPAWEPTVLNPPLREAAGWYRGDLHMHTAHSDASCPSQSGRKVPCPLFFTVQAAAKQGLDFIAITDHNSPSQFDEMRELQPYFDRVLLIPGREITTFSGHAGLLGTTAPVDFRVDGKHVKSWNALLDSIAPLHALISINHPIRPDDEDCMGCGWIAAPPIDMARVQAIEIVNGSDAGAADSGMPFWEKQLALGYRPTGIGGSDNHDAMQPADRAGSNRIGDPTTVVYAAELSMRAILDGIRAGHAFVDTEGSRDRLLEFAAQDGTQHAMMGDALHAAAGEPVRFGIHVAHAAGGHLTVLLDGKAMIPSPVMATVQTDDSHAHFDWTCDGRRHWLSVEVVTGDGRPLLIGNPIYVNPAPPR